MSDGSGFQLEGDAAARYEEFVAPVMAPLVQAALDAAELAPGDDVLDLACGTGFVTRAAHPRVGSAGTVTGIDLNPTMLAMADTTSQDLEPAVRWIDGDAMALPFDDAQFDAVVCQQGLQFVPELDRAVREATRVLRSGGRLVATVWSPMDHSPFMSAQYAAVEAVLGPERSGPLARAFACSDTQLAAAFAAAELRDVTVREIKVEVQLPRFRRFVAGHLRALPWGPALDAARDGGLEHAADAITDSLSDLVADDGTATVPFGSWLAIGRR